MITNFQKKKWYNRYSHKLISIVHHDYDKIIEWIENNIDQDSWKLLYPGRNIQNVYFFLNEDDVHKIVNQFPNNFYRHDKVPENIDNFKEQSDFWYNEYPIRVYLNLSQHSQVEDQRKVLTTMQDWCYDNCIFKFRKLGTYSPISWFFVDPYDLNSFSLMFGEYIESTDIAPIDKIKKYLISAIHNHQLQLDNWKQLNLDNS